MDFNQLNIFIYVYETGSFSVAAKNLYLTQPTISSHINKLEAELNTKLFKRTTKLVTPTPDADKLYSYARNLIAYRDKIIASFINADNIKKISFGSSTIPTNYILPAYMNSFKRVNSFVEYNQVCKKSSELIDDLLNSKLSFAFVNDIFDVANIKFIPYYSDKIVFITPNSSYYKKIIIGKNPISTLMKEPIILRNDEKQNNKSSTTFIQKLGINPSSLNVCAYINNQEEIYSKVAKGEAISLFSKIAAQNYKKLGQILVYNPISNPIKRTLYIAVSKINPPTEIEMNFIEFIQKNI